MSFCLVWRKGSQAISYVEDLIRNRSFKLPHCQQIKTSPDKTPLHPVLDFIKKMIHMFNFISFIGHRFGKIFNLVIYNSTIVYILIYAHLQLSNYLFRRIYKQYRNFLTKWNSISIKQPVTLYTFTLHITCSACQYLMVALFTIVSSLT